MLHIEEVKNLSKFESLKDDWNSLLKSSPCDTIFLRHEWVLNWWKVFGQRDSLYILLVKDGAELVGLAPLMITKTLLNVFPARVVKFIGDGNFGSADFIVEAGRSGVCECIARHLKEQSDKWDIVWLKEIRKESACAGTVELFFEAGEYQTLRKIASVCPYLTLQGTWDDFWKALKPSLRKNLMKKSRRLSEKGTVAFQRYAQNCEVAEILNRAAALEENSWKGKNRVGIFKDRRHKEFHYNFAHAAAREGWFDFSFINVDGKAVGFQYGFKYNKKFLAYNTSFDLNYSSQSPGNILALNLMQDLFREGVEEFDFLNGGENYKLDWTSKAREQIQIFVFKKSTYSHFLYVFQGKIKPRISKMIQRNVQPAFHGEVLN